MTRTKLEKLKKDLPKMNRADLVSFIWELSSDELETFADILQLAKETDYQLKVRLSSILSWYEYLAK